MGWMYSGTVLLFMRALWIYARRDDKVETLVSGQRVFDPWSKLISCSSDLNTCR
jgi:hypothetical protein